MHHQSNVVSMRARAESCGDCDRSSRCVWGALGDADSEALQQVAVNPRVLRAGEHLYRAGKRTEHLYIVRSGTLKSYVTSRDGEEQIVGFHLAGEVVGFDGLADSHGSGCYALDSSHVCQLPLKDLMAAASMSACVRDSVFRWFGQRLAASEEMLLLIGKRNAEQRLASFLLRLSGHQQRHGFSATTFTLTMSRTDIANYLSLAVETVSRILTRLQVAEFIAVDRNRVVIMDMDALEAIVDQGLATSGSGAGSRYAAGAGSAAH